MFWGLVVEPGKRYEQTVDKSFHLSKAVLEVNPDDNELVSVILEYDSQDYLLCHLQKDKVFQTTLDLHFKAGDTIAFCHSGKSSVHLTGYVTDEFDMESSDEEEEEEELSPAKKEKSGANAVKKRKDVTELPSPKAKKAKVTVAQEEEEDDDDDEDDDDFAMSGDDSDLEVEIAAEDSDSDEGSEEEDEGEEEDEQPTPAKSKKMNNAEGKGQGQIQQKNSQGKVQQQTPLPKKKNKQQKQTPSSEQNGLQSGKKLKPFPGTPKEGGKPDTPKNTPGPQESPVKKTLQGGVVIEDVKPGVGLVAKPGKQVAVYYVGRLKQNNKQFDSTTQGPGFKFHLGRSEVIKGWDVGVVGMRVGGKRRITCPPNMAYGKKGQPPVIPPNSTLVFEVELKNVN